MEYVIAVFSNRTQTIQFSNCLKKFRVNNIIINTPRELSTSCGVSVKFNLKDLGFAKKCLNMFNYTNFKNMYKIKNIYGKKVFQII